MKKLGQIAFFIFAIGVALFLYKRYRVAPDVNPLLIEVLDQNGEVKTLGELHQGTLLVNFYASWCGPCMSEMPDLQKGSLNTKGIQFIGLTDDTPERIQQVKDHFGITYPIYKLATTLKENDVYSIPTTYAFKDGVEIMNYLGPKDWSNEQLLEQLSSGQAIK
jgi:thiol-disulfide isomerase/thioredoxin